MSLEIDKLFYTVGLDIKDLKRDVDSVKKQLEGMSGSAVKEGGKMDGMFKKLGVAAAAFFSIQAISGFVKQIISVRGEFESLGISFETMLKSKEKADKLMAEVVQLAKTTPFSLTEVASGAKSLLAYGFSAKEVTGELKRLGDISAGLAIPIGDLVYLYGTTRTQGRAMTKDIMQFAGRGIPIYEELAKIFKVSTQEVSKLVEAGKVGFPEVQKVIQNLTNSGGMFENLMQKQSKSLTGMISNLGDAWAQVINIIGSGALGDMIKKAVGLVTGLFGKIVEGSKTSIEKFKEAVSEKAMLMPLITEYDALKNKTTLTANEQTRLKDVIVQIGDAIPSAISRHDAYGKALDINRGKVVAYMTQLQKTTEWLNRESIKAATAEKNAYAAEYADLNRKVELANPSETFGIGDGRSVGHRSGGKIIAGQRNAMTEDELCTANARIGELQGKMETLRQVINGLKGDTREFMAELSTVPPVDPNKTFNLTEFEAKLKSAEQIYNNYTTLVVAGHEEEAKTFYKLQLEEGQSYSEFLGFELLQFKDNIKAKEILLLAIAELEAKTDEEKKTRFEAEVKAHEEFWDAVKRRDSIPTASKAIPGKIDGSKITYTKTENTSDSGDKEKYSPEDLKKAQDIVAQGLDELSNAFAGLNDDLAEAFNTFSGIVKMVGGFASGNYLQAATSAIALVSNAVQGDAIYQEEERVRINENLKEVLQNQTENLRRQLDLLNEIKGVSTDLVKEMGIDAFNEGLSKAVATVVDLTDKTTTDFHGAYDGLTLSGINQEYIDKEIIDIQKFLAIINGMPKADQSIYSGSKNLLEKLLVQWDYIDQTFKDREEWITQQNEVITGTTSGAISDEIALGFENGKIAVMDFADTTESTIKKALMNAFKVKYLDAQLDKWYKDFATAGDQGYTTAEIIKLQTDINKIYGDAAAGLEVYNKILSGAGMGVFGEDPVSVNTQNSLAGAIKGITEDTAGVLAGQMGAIRINVLEQLAVAKTGLNYLSEIATNTRVLYDINTKLGGSAFDTLRAYGK
jgi:hypothetical protein